MWNKTKIEKSNKYFRFYLIDGKAKMWKCFKESELTNKDIVFIDKVNKLNPESEQAINALFNIIHFEKFCF